VIIKLAFSWTTTAHGRRHMTTTIPASMKDVGSPGRDREKCVFRRIERIICRAHAKEVHCRDARARPLEAAISCRCIRAAGGERVEVNRFGAQGSGSMTEFRIRGPHPCSAVTPSARAHGPSSFSVNPNGSMADWGLCDATAGTGD